MTIPPLTCPIRLPHPWDVVENPDHPPWVQTNRVLITVTTTHTPATDLGYLLHKHPDRVQEFRQSFDDLPHVEYRLLTR